jgi:hypothetical protein
MIFLAIIFIVIIGIHLGKLSKLKLKNPNTPKKQRFMEWQSLETKANLWFLWGWILFWPVAFFINLLCVSNSQPPFGLGVGIIVLIVCAIPGAISSTKAKAIQKEMGFTAKEAYGRQIKFES